MPSLWTIGVLALVYIAGARWPGLAQKIGAA